MRCIRPRPATGAVAACAILLASCSLGPRGERLPETGATLEGTVTYGSEKIPFAQILVIGSDSQATGKIGEDGRYKVANVPLGEVKIGVNTSAAKGDYMSLSMSMSYKGPDAKGKASAALPRFIDLPEKWFDPERSGIQTTIQKGSNTYDIVIPR